MLPRVYCLQTSHDRQLCSALYPYRSTPRSRQPTDAVVLKRWSLMKWIHPTMRTLTILWPPQWFQREDVRVSSVRWWRWVISWLDQSAGSTSAAPAALAVPPAEPKALSRLGHAATLLLLSPSHSLSREGKTRPLSIQNYRRSPRTPGRRPRGCWAPGSPAVFLTTDTPRRTAAAANGWPIRC